MDKKKNDIEKSDVVKQPTQKALAKKYNVTLRTVQRWKADGIDIYDEAAVQKHIDSQQRPPEGQQQKALKIEGSTLHEQLRNCKNYAEINFIKKKIDAEKGLFQFQVEQGEYTKNTEIKEAHVRILTVLKSGMLKAESDWPNKLAGLTAAQMQKEIKTLNQELLRSFMELLEEVS